MTILLIRRGLSAGVGTAALAALSAAQVGVALPGRLAFIREGVVRVGLAGAATPIAAPHSQRAVSLSLSPRGGALVFFAPREKKAGDEAAPLQAFVTRPPYSAAIGLPIFLTKDDDTLVTWTADGKADIAIGDLKTRRVDPKTGMVTVLEDPAGGSKARKGAGGGGTTVYADGDGRVLLHAPGATEDRALFSPAKPEALFAAFQRAHAPAKLKELSDEIDPMLWKDAHNWSVGNPAITPDRKTVFFAANLGTGMGAQGNTNFCLFAADVATGKLAVLSKAGGFFGRVPIDCQVSPDGQRLFFATSVHSSAADNSFLAYVVDLPTQQVRELLRADPARKNDANLMDSWGWSPDGRYVAISALFYDPKTVADADPDMGKSTTYVYDAGTGRFVREAPHARAVQWAGM